MGSSPIPSADEYQEEDYNPPSANYNPVNKLKMRYINRTGDRTSYSTEVIDGKVKLFLVTCKFPKGETTGCHSNEQTAKDIAALRAFTGEGKTHQPRKEKPKSKIYRFEAINLNFTSEELRKIRSDFYEGLHCEEFLPYKVQLVKQQEKSKIIIETEDINAAFSMAKKFKDTFLCVLRKYGICD